MKINGQNIIANSTYYILTLKEPFWSAYQKYGWEDGVEGFGINIDILNQALKTRHKILVKYKADYEITPAQALKLIDKYKSTFTARSGVLLGIIPRTAFKRLPDQEELFVKPALSVYQGLKERYPDLYKKLKS